MQGAQEKTAKQEKAVCPASGWREDGGSRKESYLYIWAKNNPNYWVFFWAKGSYSKTDQHTAGPPWPSPLPLFSFLFSHEVNKKDDPGSNLRFQEVNQGSLPGICSLFPCLDLHSRLRSHRDDQPRSLYSRRVGVGGGEAVLTCIQDSSVNLKYGTSNGSHHAASLAWWVFAPGGSFHLFGTVVTMCTIQVFSLTWLTQSSASEPVASHSAEGAVTTWSGAHLPHLPQPGWSSSDLWTQGRNPSWHTRAEGGRVHTGYSKSRMNRACLNSSNQAPWPLTRSAAEGSRQPRQHPGLTLGVQRAVKQGQETRLPEGVAAVHQLVAAALKSTFKPHLPACHPLLSGRQRRERHQRLKESRDPASSPEAGLGGNVPRFWLLSSHSRALTSNFLALNVTEGSTLQQLL